MKIFRALFAATATGLLVASGALAQEAGTWKGGGGWSQRSSYGSMYDPQTVGMLEGEIVAVDKFVPAKNMSYGVHALMKTDKETISVHLGPGWYIENQDVQIASGDKVEVKGSRVTYEGKPALIAAEVTKGDDVLVLRDSHGFPRWSGWRRR